MSKWIVDHQKITDFPFVTNGNVVITTLYDESEMTEEMASQIAKALNELKDNE